MAHAFDIVCDDGCDLSAEDAAALGVAVVPTLPPARRGHLATADAEALAAAYRSAEAPVVISLHTSSRLADTLSAAEPHAGERVRIVDTGTMSAGLGLLVRLAARLRDSGATVEEALKRLHDAAETMRIAMVTTPDEKPLAGGAGRPRFELLAHADSLKARIVGERRLIGVKSSERPVELLRTTDLSDATGRAAHLMSNYAARMGTLSYVLIVGGNEAAARQLAKPLDTNEFEARPLGRAYAGSLTRSLAGAGCAGVAYLPQALIPELLS